MKNNNDFIAISVIIPIYNVEKYLKECIDSVVNQTLKNIEIICIDDGSLDNSGKIIDEYSKQDCRIKVIHKKNTGYGNSMNIGIANAIGKYIAIVEPDDFISTNMYEELFTIAEAQNIDVVKSNFIRLSNEKFNYQYEPTRIVYEDILYGKILDKEERKPLFKGYIAHWSSLYNREFLKTYNIHFNETPGASFQDAGFWFQTLIFAKTFYLHEGYYYYYRCDNPNSSMFNTEKIFCLTREYNYIFNILKNQEKLLEEYIPIYVYCRFMGLYAAIDRVNETYKLEYIYHIANDLNELEKQQLLNTTYMDERIKKELNEIKNTPKKFYERKISFSLSLHQLTAPYEKLYIYGAGVMGKKVYENLFEEDKAKVQTFLVTKQENQVSNIDGKKVEEFGKVVLDINAAIIVGVTKRYEEEIIQILKNNGISKIILLEEIENL